MCVRYVIFNLSGVGPAYTWGTKLVIRVPEDDLSPDVYHHTQHWYNGKFLQLPILYSNLFLLVRRFAKHIVGYWPHVATCISFNMGLLPDTSNCGLRMRRKCWERFPHHQLQRKPLVNDPGMHHATCVTHVPWCLSGSLTHAGENVSGIPGACATRSLTYLARGPLAQVIACCVLMTLSVTCVWTVHFENYYHIF